MPRHSAHRAAVARAVGCWIVAAGAIVAQPLVALAASPSPTPGPALGDPRSSGQGPGLVGDPMSAIVIVVAIAFLTIVVTLLYVRATAGRPRG